jgi:hypothetical protein
MKIGRNMIIAIMITFCFTATLFMVIPIRSANSPYDPWIDYNDDGKINLQELVLLANSYGTTGDPTKNVNVTNWGGPIQLRRLWRIEYYICSSNGARAILLRVSSEGIFGLFCSHL